MSQKLLQAERVAASLDIQFGVGVPEQVHRGLIHASAMIIIPNRIAERIQCHLVAILRNKQRGCEVAAAVFQIVLHDPDQRLGKRHDLLITCLHVAEKHCPGGKVQISDLQVEQRGRTAAGTKQEVDNDPIAVFGKGAGLAVRFLQQLLQLVGGVGLLDRIICTHQSDRILFQIAFFHAPVQERTHHAEVRIDGRIVELLVLHIEDIVLHRFFCDGMNGLLCISQKPKEASALCGVEVE